MKAVIATCFESNEERASSVYEVLKKLAYEVRIFSSDYSHIRKEKRKSHPENVTLIEARPYSRNLSLQRIVSHSRFAKDLFARIEEEKADLIWLMAPANSLIAEAKKYKKGHPETRLVIDIIDMWPESLPLSISKDLFPLNLWKKLRDDNIGCADALVCECDLYKEILRKHYSGNITTIRWARHSEAVVQESECPDDRMVLVYIGSINHIIDAERIASVISEIDSPVSLHVIGEGENTDHFLEVTEKVCEVIYHGAVRDEKAKADIFAKCHAGINIYREGLYIGLTVKCIDYFGHGLPIINNIRGDTWDFVETYDAGINLDGNSRIDVNKLLDLRKNNQRIYDLYNENLTKEVFEERCRKVIEEIMQ